MKNKFLYRNIDIMLDRESGMSFSDIGKKFGLSRQRVTKIYKSFLEPENVRNKRKWIKDRFDYATENF